MFRKQQKQKLEILFCIMYKFHNSYLVVFVDVVILGFFILYMLYILYNIIIIFYLFCIFLLFIYSVYFIFYIYKKDYITIAQQYLPT